MLATVVCTTCRQKPIIASKITSVVHCYCLDINSSLRRILFYLYRVLSCLLLVHVREYTSCANSHHLRCFYTSTYRILIPTIARYSYHSSSASLLASSSATFRFQPGSSLSLSSKYLTTNLLRLFLLSSSLLATAGGTMAWETSLS